ncbi:competence protein CoiA family protein [Thalassospira australica]|uniref:competence protein CoiA family protein n=1 Tax=Thalassospira australica TaxID=1528106 RepID=UPI00051A02D5|nr:competence protein CoiA family protein [Thalassospira australica]
MATTELKLVFGKAPSNSQIMHISEVPSGKGCNCICPQCGSALLAKKGKIRQHHFSHDGRKDCGIENESVLHLFAKNIFFRKKVIKTPKLAINYKGHTKNISEKIVNFDSVALEVNFGKFRIDAIGRKDTNPLMVEFFYTHAVEDEKRQYLTSKNVSTLEIDISNAPLGSNINTITSYILHAAPRAWIHNSKIPEFIRKIDDEFEKKNLEESIKNANDIKLKIHIGFTKENTETLTRRVYGKFYGFNYFQRVCIEKGYSKLFNKNIHSDYFFKVGYEHWQSSLIYNMIILNGFGCKIHKEKVYRFLSQYICRDFLVHISDTALDIIREEYSRFQPPIIILNKYLEFLEENGTITQEDDYITLT